MAENFPNLKHTDIKIQEAQRAPNKLNPNRPTSRHIIIKMAKVKERTLKPTREKQSINYKGTPIRLSADSSTLFILLFSDFNSACVSANEFSNFSVAPYIF